METHIQKSLTKMGKIRKALFLIVPALIFLTENGIAQNYQQQNARIQPPAKWLSVEGIWLVQVEDFVIHSPETFKNLSLYLITGQSANPTQTKIQTLNEGLENKSVIVAETGNVSELMVKNMSKKYDVFINAGDIVKGGKQDRTITFDLWVPRRTESPLASFCVEANRWAQRDEEDVAGFSENKYMLSSRKLKIASQVEYSQGKVWEKVAEQQTKISDNMDTDVRSETSKSSLQLTLENEKLRKIIEKYKKAFSDFAISRKAIGFAYAINGELYGVNYYHSHALFLKLREKLIEAAIVEAISENTSTKSKVPSRYAVGQAMDLIVGGKSTHYIMNNRHNLSLKWSHATGYMVESRIRNSFDKKRLQVYDFDPAHWLHRSYIFK
jgi:hypothetical protein